jgi:hypothetical protein
MFQHMMGGTMIWGMSVWGWRRIILVVLSIAALVKYLVSK